MEIEYNISAINLTKNPPWLSVVFSNDFKTISWITFLISMLMVVQVVLVFRKTFIMQLAVYFKIKTILNTKLI